MSINLSVSFLVHGLHVRPGNSWAFGRSLRRFQEEVIEYVTQGTPSILLDAPVGSGKTLAALAAAQASGGPTVLTYPTNSLAEDQARSVASLLAGQYCVEIRQLCSKTLEWVVVDRPEGGGHRFGIALVNGDILDAATEKGVAKGVSLKSLLGKLSEQYGRDWIMLTNVDLLAHALTGRYRHSETIVEYLMSIKLVVLDEFHFYRGPSLAASAWTASFLVHGQGSVLAMSGTLTDPGNNVLPGQALVRETGAEEESWPKVRWEVDVTMKLDPTARAYDRKIHSVLVEQVAEQVEGSLTEKANLMTLKGPAPRAVVILNSPIDAMAVARRLRDSERVKHLDLNVFEAHGLTGLAERHHGSWAGNVIVGTSAIEVGIDFKTPVLVAQAWDSYSFVQRFGRVGRSAPGSATFFVPEHLVNAMVKRFKGEDTTYRDFVETVKHYLEPPRLYGEFVSSRYGRFVMASLLKEILRGPLVTEPASQFLQSFMRERGFGPDFLKVATSRLYTRVSEGLMRTGSSLVRDAGLNAAAIVDVDGRRWFMEVDLVDASRWGTLELLSADTCTHLAEQIPPRFRDNPIVLVTVKLDKPPPSRLEVAITTWELGNTGLRIVGKAGDAQLKTPPDIARRLAEGLLCYLTTPTRLHMIGDWRIRGVYTPEGRVALLGANALLAKYLAEQQEKDEIQGNRDEAP